ncbi:MAG TPA: inositol monophosphatase family protein [Polyangiaceae bacterium]|jgi:fructose-1,6-bisphosphatase/inositol monophosphatase family enzyme|nr:inositol monophosphatase family protein [Polyangiaceae bacterium]
MADTARVLEALGELLQEVAEREILPRWQRLAEGDIISKASASDPEDLVTVADRVAERVLTARLPELWPGSVVIGEEAVAEAPSVLDALHGERPVWLVDPIDGTKNFAAGSQPFGVMVALVEHGETVLSGIYLPVERDLYLAERGSGATCNGQRFVAHAPGSGKLTGTLYTRFMPPAVLGSLNARPEQLLLAESPQCAAFEYARLARGARDFALYYRLFPWDHAPGVLLVREAGGMARSPQEPGAREYSPRDAKPMLLVAADAARWETVRNALFTPPAGVRPTET